MRTGAVPEQGKISNEIVTKHDLFQTFEPSTLQNGGLVDCPHAESIDVSTEFPDTRSSFGTR